MSREKVSKPTWENSGIRGRGRDATAKEEKGGLLISRREEVETRKGSELLRSAKKEHSLMKRR